MARIKLRFGWISDHGDVSPQSDILLQVVTDVFATSLTRIGSALAPTSCIAAPEPPAPDLVPAAGAGAVMRQPP
jgi:hypothetical protein